MRKRLTVSLLALLLTGCASWTPFHRINLGMSKDEVINTLGRPCEVSGAGNEEYLWYVPVNKFWKRYYVRLEKGRVESYGPVGGGNEKP